MGLKTNKEYIELLPALHPTAYMFGERVTDVVDNPRARAWGSRRPALPTR